MTSDDDRRDAVGRSLLRLRRGAVRGAPRFVLRTRRHCPGQKVDTFSDMQVVHAHRLGREERFAITYANERSIVRRLVAHDVVQRLAVRKRLARLRHAIELRRVGAHRQQLPLELVRDVDDEGRLAPDPRDR